VASILFVLALLALARDDLLLAALLTLVAGGIAITGLLIRRWFLIVPRETVDAIQLQRMVTEQLHQLNRNISIANTAARAAIFAPEREEAFRAICRGASELTGAEGAIAYLIDRRDGQLHLSFHERVASPLNWNDLNADLLRETDSPIVVHAGTASAGQQQLLRRAQYDGFQSVLLLPLKSGAVPLGLLVLLYRQVHTFSASTLELLQLLGTQLSSFLDNSELFRVLESYAFEMAQISHLSRISTSSMNLTQVATDVTVTMSDIADAAHTTLVLIDSDARLVREIAASDRDPARGGVAQASLPLDKLPELEALNASATTKPAFFRAGVMPFSDGLRQLCGRNGDVMFGIFPLVAEQRTLGAIVFGYTNTLLPEDRSVQLIETAANQFALQLHNILLYRETQEALRRRLEQLSLIEDIARQISSSLDFDRIIEQVLEAALSATQGDRATLVIRAHGEDNYTLLARGRGETDPVERVSVVGAFVELLMQDRHARLFNAREELPPSALQVLHPGMQSVAAVPLERDSQVVGALYLESTANRFFSTEQLTFLTSLANHALISLENARLMENSAYQIRTLRALQELALRLSSAIDTRSVMAGILETARDLLGADAAAMFQHTADDQQVSLKIVLPSSSRETVAKARPAAQRAAQSGEIATLDRITRSGIEVHVPVPGRGGTRAVISLFYDQKRMLLPRDFDTLRSLVAQAAGHLENARLHEEIRASNDQLGAVLKSGRDGMVILDRDGRMLDCNPAAERLLGINSEQFINKPFVAMLNEMTLSDEMRGMGYSRAELTELARLIRLQPERVTRREFSRELNGGRIFVEEIGSPVLSTNNAILGRLLVFRDVTEQKMLAEYRNEITNMLVHDLRGPLSSVITGIEFALTELNDTGETTAAQQTLDIGVRSARALMNLVESLLDIARLEAREMPLTRSFTTVEEVVRFATDALQGSILEASIQLEVDIDPHLEPIEVDRDMIRRVITNLLDNAVRYTPNQSRIIITARRGSRDVIIRVNDSGPGIPPSERERIFERYSQIKSQAPKRGAKGSGLGLTFCRLAVEAHGGRIWVDNDCTLPGACFAISLPIATVRLPASPQGVR
jgi:PAS domain S-box-containing protein